MQMNNEGVGLGLFNTNQLIKIVGPKTQQFTIESQLNEGSKFGFTVCIDNE